MQQKLAIMMKEAALVIVSTLLFASFAVGIQRAGCDVQFNKGHIHFRKLPSYDGYIYVAIDLEGVEHANSSYSVHIHKRILQSNHTEPLSDCCGLGPPHFYPHDKNCKGTGGRRPRRFRGRFRHPHENTDDKYDDIKMQYENYDVTQYAVYDLGDLGTYMSVGNDLDYESKLFVLTMEVANATNRGIIGRGISVRGPDGRKELCCKIYDGDETYANAGDD